MMIQEMKIDPVQFVNLTVANAERFHETQAVLKAWLNPLEIYITNARDEWQIYLLDRKWKGKEISRASFPTYAEALAFALKEAEKRIKEAI